MLQLVVAIRNVVRGNSGAREYITCLVQRWLTKQLHPVTYKEIYDANPEVYHCDAGAARQNPFFYHFSTAWATTFFTILIISFFAKDVYHNFKKGSFETVVVSGTKKSFKSSA